jgi:tetratricopeptide (TPR) repeat protein
VIERGAVQGELFHRAAVEELGNGAGADGLDSDLVGLVRKELIRPERGQLPDEEAYRFRHLLIRDVAYDGLPKEIRADLHLRFARWVSAHARIVELDEIVGYHLEQSALYRRELGRPDPDVERQAAARLTSAGESAAAREDLPAAETLLDRALALLPPGDSARDRPLYTLLSALMWSGKYERVEELVTELASSADPVMRMNGRVAHAEHKMNFDPSFGSEELRRVAEEAMEVYARLGDDEGLSHVWMVLAHASWLESQSALTLECVERAKEHALLAGTLNIRSFALAVGPLTHGPLRPEQVRTKLAELFGGTDSRFLTQGALMTESMLERFEGHFDQCIAHWEQADKILADLGLNLLRHVMRQIVGECAYAQENYEEAARVFREVYDGLGELGEVGFRSTVGIELGEALYSLGELDEPERLAIDAETMSTPDDLVNFALGRALRAKISADRGDVGAAQELIRQATEFAMRSDFPQLHARVFEADAQVHRAAGNVDESRSLIERAIEAHESHGDKVLAERDRRLLVEL